MKLLDLQSNCTPEDSRTHIRIPFVLTQATEELRIRFEYAPKTLDDREHSIRLLEKSFEEYLLPTQRQQAITHVDQYLPLKNLITLSIDDEQGYRGACHRHDEIQNLSLSASKASPGLMAGPLRAGSWSVTLSLHCIVTESCSYRLQIWTAEAEEEGS